MAAPSARHWGIKQKIEEKEVGSITYSILIGLVATFVSLVYYHYEYLGVWDLAGFFHAEATSAYGFPFGWILPQRVGLLGVFELGSFLMDVGFWTIVAYAMLRYVIPHLIKFTQKRK